MKTSFTYPLSNTRNNEGQLEVEALVDGNEAEVRQVIFCDKYQRRMNVTTLANHFEGMRKELEAMAVNNVANLYGRDPNLEDVTMMEQDNY
jgi:hypothetical protein